MIKKLRTYTSDKRTPKCGEIIKVLELATGDNYSKTKFYNKIIRQNFIVDSSNFLTLCSPSPDLPSVYLLIGYKYGLLEDDLFENKTIQDI